MERKIGIGTAEACNEVVLEGSYGYLGSIMMMDSWWYQLKVDIFVAHLLLKYGRCLIVKALKRRTKSSRNENGNAFFKGYQMGGSCSNFYGFSMDEIGIKKIIEDEKLDIALAAGKDKTASLV
jgi:hypothetical protein